VRNRHLVRDPADIGQASAPFGVFGSAVAAIHFLGICDFLDDDGTAVFCDIAFDILNRVAKAVTNQYICHFISVYFFVDP
jgi:hypothetical protein